MPAPIASFTNPASGTCYRLVCEADGWRISKSRTDNNRILLVHLRGRPGADPAPVSVIARLVAGQGGILEQPADPHLVFAAVVVVDIERTGDLLTALAREAESVYTIGCKGFRPRSPVLRRLRDQALARSVTEMRAMADAWLGSGLVAGRGLPDWLQAAIDDRLNAENHEA